jgi:hypothetical protein
MAVVYALVAIVGLMCALDLFLTVGVIRRLREHTALLAGGSADGPPPQVMLGPDEPVGEFEAAALTGESITQEIFLEGPTLVGVFAQGCGSCEERLPGFLEHAKKFSGGPEQVLAVVVGDPATGSLHVGDLQAVGHVVVEEKPGEPVTTALGVTGYPAFAMVGTDGTVRSSGTLLAHALV